MDPLSIFDFLLFQVLDLQVMRHTFVDVRVTGTFIFKSLIVKKTLSITFPLFTSKILTEKTPGFFQFIKSNATSSVISQKYHICFTVISLIYLHYQ